MARPAECACRGSQPCETSLCSQTAAWLQQLKLCRMAVCDHTGQQCTVLRKQVDGKYVITICAVPACMALVR